MWQSLLPHWYPMWGILRPKRDMLPRHALETPPAMSMDSHLPVSQSLDGQRRRGEAAQHGQPSVASLPWIQPVAAQVQPHLCQPPPQPRAPGGDGDGAPSPWWRGTYQGLFQALRCATSAAQLSGLLRANPASPCKRPAQRHLRQPRQRPQASGLQDGGEGGVGVWRGEG